MAILVQTTPTIWAPLLDNEGRPHALAIDIEVARQLHADWPNHPDQRASRVASKRAVVEALAIGAALAIVDPRASRIQQLENQITALEGVSLRQRRDEQRIAALRAELRDLVLQNEEV
jgi:hypothetical protein